MNIEILGTGCSKYNKTKELVEKAVKETAVDAEIVKVEDSIKSWIRSYGHACSCN